MRRKSRLRKELIRERQEIENKRVAMAKRRSQRLTKRNRRRKKERAKESLKLQII